MQKSSMVQNRNVRKNTSAHRENVILQKNVAAASIREWIMKSSSTRNIGK